MDKEVDELMDMVDTYDHPVGTILRSKVAELQNTEFYRAACAFVENDKGQLWIPRRQLYKKIAPGGLDFSMAEHLKSGETYEEGTIRGLSEELYLDVKPEDIEWVGKLDPLPHVPIFVGLYRLKLNEIEKYLEDDFTGFEWLTPAELAARIRAGDKAKDCLLPALEKFYDV